MPSGISMNRTFVLNFLLALSVSTLPSVQAEESIAEAQQHLAKQEYAKAFAVIEKNLADDKASIEILTVGSQVAWQAGETITAAHAITALLKRDKDASADIYYLGAQIARAIGDYTIAGARYSRFAQLQEMASPKLKDALQFILETNPGLAEFKMWDAFYHQDAAAFALARDTRYRQARQELGCLVINNAQCVQARDCPHACRACGQKDDLHADYVKIE